MRQSNRKYTEEVLGWVRLAKGYTPSVTRNGLSSEQTEAIYNRQLFTKYITHHSLQAVHI
jgi:hypothetical protein